MKNIILPVCLALTLVWLGPQAGFAADKPQVDPDGTIHIPALLLPESSLLDSNTRERMRKSRESAADAQGKQQLCPPEAGADKAAMPQIRQCLAEAFSKSEKYRKLIERYGVAMAAQQIGGVYTEVFTPKEGIAPQNKDRVLINLHGGHFKSGSRWISHLESIPIASVGKFKVISIDYRLAPEYAFPAASEDVAAVYRQILKTYPPRNVGLYGCSAGSLLTAQSIAWFLKEGLPLPGAIGLFGGGAAYYQEGDSGQFSVGLTGFPLDPASQHPYFKGTKSKDPLVFPIHSEQILAKFPPSLLIAATRDVGQSAAVYTHSQLVKLGVDARPHMWDGLLHCFPFGQDVPQADDAHEVIVRFFDSHLDK